MQCTGKYVLLCGLMAVTLVSVRGQAGPDATIPAPDYHVPRLDTGAVSIQPDQSGFYKPFFVRSIIVSGNRKTKENIILRELPFSVNHEYQLPELVSKFEEARRQLMNTTLFHDVVVALKRFEGYNVDIEITVKERWYLFPLPYFKPIDRNINQWLIEKKASFNRVDYGVKVLHNNFTGRNDKLNLWLVNGYTKRVSMSYDRLYIDKRMKWGGKIGLNMGKNREVNFDTQENKQVFFKDENSYVRSFFNVYAEMSYRRKIKTRHRIGIAYSSETVADTVVQLNNRYLMNGSAHISYPELYYTMTFFDVDYIPYPLRGYQAEVYLNKKGINSSLNVWQTTLKGLGSWPIAKQAWFSTSVLANLKLPFKQPFYTQRLMGYNDFSMQGYEYFVMDGVAGFLIKNTITKQLFGFNIGMPVKKSSIEKIPFKVFAKIYSNVGYVYNRNPGTNFLNNRMLYTGGVGIDILTFYDFVMRFEWSFNQIGQNGLYLHKRSNF